MEFKNPSFQLEAQYLYDSEVMDWGIKYVKAPQAWQKTKGRGVKVAVLDTGIDQDHPDLRDNIKGGVNFTSSNHYDYEDRQSHGTHCAGVIAGVDNRIGVIGVAPEASLYAVKVLGDDGSGDLTWIMQGVEWAIQNGMDVISMSLGTGEQPPEIFHEVFKKAYQANIPVVVATGNENTHVGWPAAYEEVLAVGAIGRNYSRAWFSNYGPEIDLVAPGVGIYSTVPNGRYATMSGTSMATPIITGCIALLLAQLKAEGKTMTVPEIYQALQNATVDLGAVGKDNTYGSGLVDLSKLID